MAFKLICR